MLVPKNGVLLPPEGPGWGIQLDEEKVEKYRDLHNSGNYKNIYDNRNAKMTKRQTCARTFGTV